MIIDENGNVESFEPDPGPGIRLFKWITSHPLVIIIPALVLVAGYSVLWVMTSRIRRQAVDFLSSSLHAELQVKSVEVTPALRIILEDVSAVSTDSSLKLPDLKARKVMLAADVPSLLSGQVKLSEVFLLGAEVTVYQEPDGTYNISRWLGRASECDADSVRKLFPGRINVRNSRIVMEPPPGAHWHDTRELAELDGVVGLTRDGNIGINLTATAFNSPVILKGGMPPCDSTGFSIKGISDMFNFSALRDAVDEMIVKNDDSAFNLPGGSGKLSFGVEGDILSPYVSGEASLQDFDAGFTYSDHILNISDFKSGMGSERITGSGAVNFGIEGLPFNFTLVMEDVDLRRHVRQLQGFNYPPEGRLSGVLKINGLIEEGQTVVESGSITVTDGAIIVPDPGFTTSSYRGNLSASIPFTELSARVFTSKGKLRFSNIAVTADDWAAKGWAWIDEAILSGGSAEGLGYYSELEIESGNLPMIASEFPSLRGKLGGAMKANLKASGSIGSTDGLSGSGNVKVLQGFIGNPYRGSANYSFQTIDFDLAEASFILGPHTMQISGATITGDGIDIEADGTVGYGGNLEITAKAVMAPERARDFSGLARFVAGRDMFTMTTYTARCDISGDFQNPVSTWHEPSITRWGR